MRLPSLGFLMLGIGLTTIATAQDELSGRQQYPQFRVLSGLPGGGFGVLADGRPSIRGAAALTTPVGYTLGRGSYAFGIFNTSDNGNPFRFDSSGASENTGNGSAYGMLGFSYKGYRMTVGGMLLSTTLDSEMNLQFSPPSFGRIGVSAGVQDVFSVAGASGEALDRRENILSRSFYVVGTYDLGDGAYLSLGKGERRFQGLFGNASFGLTDRLRAMVEYDGFNFNAGLLYNIGNFEDWTNTRWVDCTLFLGAVRGKYATLGLSFTL